MKLGFLARTLALALLCAAVLLGTAWSRALFEARAEKASAEVALRAGDVDTAIAQLRLAARWNAPGNAYAEQALGLLEGVAASAEARGDLDRALAAQRAIHAAIHASRGIVTLSPERLERADQRIAELMAREPPPELDAARSEAERKRAFLALLRVDGPQPWWVLVAFLGFVTWVGGASIFLLWGVDREGRLLRRIAKPSALALVLGWIAFALGLRLA